MALREVRAGEATLEALLRRTESTWSDVVAVCPGLRDISPAAAEQVERDVKYAGYVARQDVEIARQRRLAEKRIPANFDFSAIHHLRAEALEKLLRIRPTDLGQASRISGITPADLSLVLVHLDGRGRPASG
jgi:tRNA uridine 5-carboxymethylaminomethyl modification enzyme